MQGKSVRSDIERAVSKVGVADRQPVPVPRQKPVQDEIFNPNWTREEIERRSAELYFRGLRAGETGQGEKEVIDFINKWGNTGFGSYMTRGYEQGRKRRPRSMPKPARQGQIKAPYDDVPR